MNATKTEYITFGCYYNTVPESTLVKVNNKVLQKCEKTKYLGILVDYNLNGTYILKQS